MDTIARGRFEDGGIDYLALERQARLLRVAAVREMVAWVRGWLARHVFQLNWPSDHTAEPLYAMSDRELADIGISRGDIDSVAAGTYQDGHGRMLHPMGPPAM